jgi:two-component system cell cycle response regulator
MNGESIKTTSLFQGVFFMRHASRITHAISPSVGTFTLSNRRTNNMKKILIIEDDKKITAALAIRLEAAGYDVLAAGDGVGGLKLALDHKPDLIIMDIWMPAGLGFSVAQRLRSLGVQNTPIVFITASRLQGLKEAAQEVGAVAFLEKPYDPERLLAIVAQAVNAGTLERDAAMACC